ncbi:hypothetical protein, partial [Fusicatenibacter saccharivorans]
MSKRKFSKKEVAISIAAAALAIATVGGAVAIHKDSSNSNTGHSITVEQSDYSKKKEEAIQQIQDAVKDLSDVHIPQELRIRSRGTERHSA